MTSKDELREKLLEVYYRGKDKKGYSDFELVTDINLILNLLEGEKQKVRIDEQYAYDRQLVKCPFRYNDRDELAEFRLVLVDERFAPKPDDKLKQIEVDLTNTLEQFLQQPGGHSSPSSPRIAAEYFITRINDYIATLNKEPNKGEDV